MDKAREDEATAYMDSDWDEQWHDACVAAIEKKGPNEEDDKEEFDALVKERFDDKQEREMWATDYVEWDCVVDNLKTMCEDIDGIDWFLKDHPVEDVQANGSEGEVHSLTDVAGYCFECNEPQTWKSLTKHTFLMEGSSDVAPPHKFSPLCDTCEVDRGDCAYDPDGDPRMFYFCNYCGDIGPVQSFPGEVHIHPKNPQPFNWPPGAPWPPRRTFAGTPDEVPPWED